MITKLLIDTHEHKRVTAVQNYYMNFIKDIHVKELRSGDYIFIDETGQKCAFEFKTGEDYLASIYDTRLHNEAYTMCQYFDFQFVIVMVGDWEKLIEQHYFKSGQKVSIQQVLGSIASLNCMSTVLVADSFSNVLYLMYRQATKCFNKKPLHWKFGKKNRNTVLNYLCSIHGVGERLAGNIVQTLDLHTLTDLLNVSVADLKSVELVGDKTAKLILRELGVDTPCEHIRKTE